MAYRLSWKVRWRLRLECKKNRLLDKVYWWRFRIAFGPGIPVDAIRSLRRAHVTPAQVVEFCERFLVRGYHKCEKNHVPPEPSPFASVNDAVRYWIQCNQRGYAFHIGDEVVSG